eukprot:TRINITY_DN51568_c0_g1_i1.p1 TRINITY_DN51568_c0_g1~~TRINITY_DN51568_c0_g1_i1.p1  ORF type:complete len:952 (-),score=178.12 TRINITY_DN51568_c0_g1_i1:196-2682(-)
MDRMKMEAKFGRADPRFIAEELRLTEADLENRLSAMSDHELQDEVLALQDWRAGATGRLRTLELRAAWAVLGLTPGSADRSVVRKAFKRRALELHPDKGGDVERFQLLQEMKELLDEPGSTAASRGKHQENEDKRNGKEQRVKKKVPTTSHESDEDSEFSDCSYDAGEEFEKIFGKKTRRNREKMKHDDNERIEQNDGFHRGKYVAARRRLHRSLSDIRARAGKFADEVRRASAVGESGSGNTTTNASSDAMRQLRKFLDRFVRNELVKLSDSRDSQTADNIFRRFLEQGCEIICAAAAIDPKTTVSSVAMQVNYPILAAGPSADLRRSCAALLEAISSLSTTLERLSPFAFAASQIEDAAAVQACRAHKVRLLMPCRRSASEDIDDVAIAEVDLPSTASVGDLRAVARRTFGGRGELRFFCSGRFLGDDTASFGLAVGAGENVDSATPTIVHCLPSNKVELRKGEAAQATTASTHDQSAAQAGNSCNGDVLKAHAASAHVLKEFLLAEVSTNKNETASRLVAESLARRRVEERSAEQEDENEKDSSKTSHRQENRCCQSFEYDNEGGRVDGDAFFDTFSHSVKPFVETVSMQTCEAPLQQIVQNAWKQEEVEKEEKGKENKNQEFEGGKSDKEEEDAWFDDFFSGSKPSVESQDKAKDRPPVVIDVAQNVEKRPSNFERCAASRYDSCDKNSSFAKFVGASPEWGEDHRVELPTGLVQTTASSPATGVGQPDRPFVAGTETQKPTAQVRAGLAFQLTKVEEKSTLDLKRSKCCWDASWEHPCAGDRLADGSGIFCYPCNVWVTLFAPFEHTNFEAHCDQLGHYGWID